LVSWEFEIAPGALRALWESEFLEELRGAVAAVLADYQSQVTLLTDECFDLGLPRWRRVARTVEAAPTAASEVGTGRRDGY
jgi:hypothetical protein